MIDNGLIHICLDFLHVVEHFNIFCLWIMSTIVFVLNILDSVLMDSQTVVHNYILSSLAPPIFCRPNILKQFRTHYI